MREILFRGKSINSCIWEVGHLLVFPKTGRTKILTYEEAALDFNNVEVDRSTVGQYTGLTDKNGKRIFEGDVLRWVGPDGESGKVYVRFSGGVFGFHSVECPLPDLFSDFEEGCQTLEVIGNIHENPELLKGESNG